MGPEFVSPPNGPVVRPTTYALDPTVATPSPSVWPALPKMRVQSGVGPPWARTTADAITRKTAARMTGLIQNRMDAPLRRGMTRRPDSHVRLSLDGLSRAHWTGQSIPLAERIRGGIRVT